MVELSPCPNPECHGCKCELFPDEWGRPLIKHWQVNCDSCGYHGPWADSEEEAARLHNAMPRKP